MLALIPLLPFIGFLVNAFFGKRLSKSISGGVACLVMLAAFGVSLASVVSMLSTPDRAIEQTVYTWITSGTLNIGATFRVDPLTSVMILVITGIGSLIHIYSTAYMHEETDSEYARYFSYLNLFAAFMLVLVLGANFPMMFVGWEGVGLCSYLLIGFWYKKQSATDAGKKAFIVNRIGDFAFILGTLLLFWQFGTLDFQGVASKVAALPVETHWGVLSVASLLLFIGATGKSAQIPLYVWLPDAMEGPTPVSALIHAATMVTAGVYMIGRNAVLFSHAPEAMQVVAVIGASTALFAGTIGLVQNDIKRVLAYSTVSQLGYMFLAMGVGAFSAGIFHLYTHAFFKALLFLGSRRRDPRAARRAGPPEDGRAEEGPADHLLDVPDWRHRDCGRAGPGGLLQQGPDSRRGLPDRPHDAVGRRRADRASDRHLHVPARLHGVPWRAACARLAWAHDAHDAHGHADAHGHGGHLHDAPPAMALALIVLAIGSVVAGYVGVPAALGGHNEIEHYLAPSFAARGALNLPWGRASALQPAKPAPARPKAWPLPPKAAGTRPAKPAIPSALSEAA